MYGALGRAAMNLRIRCLSGGRHSVLPGLFEHLTPCHQGVFVAMVIGRPVSCAMVKSCPSTRMQHGESCLFSCGLTDTPLPSLSSPSCSLCLPRLFTGKLEPRQWSRARQSRSTFLVVHKVLEKVLLWQITFCRNAWKPTIGISNAVATTRE